jgi:hypothetical protein
MAPEFNETRFNPLIQLNREEKNFQAFASPAKDIVGGFERYQCFAMAAWGDRLTNALAPGHRLVAFQTAPRVYRRSSEKAKAMHLTPGLASRGGRDIRR